MKPWKDLFQTHILESGLNYYEDGYISNLKQTPTGYLAFVEDTDDDYYVNIEMQDELVSKITCTCSSGKKGRYCEHMAATLYELEENKQNIKIATSSLKTIQKQKQDLKKIISKISTEELQEMMYSLTLSNESIYNMIMIKYAPITKKQMTRLKKQVDKICDQCFDDEYVDYYQLKDSLNQLLQEYIPLLLDNKYKLEAFELINHIFYKVGTQNVDDLFDCISLIGNTCYKYWKTILQECNEEETKQMCQWFLNHKENYVIVDLEEYINDFLLNELKDETTLHEQLHQLDDIINQKENENYSGESFSAYYGATNNITSRIQLMEKLNYSKAEILEYRKQHRHFSEIRKMEIQEYLSNKNYQEAIAVLKESKLLDANQKNFVMEYSEQLIQIYEDLHMQKEYMEELEYQVLHFTQLTLTYLLKLKELYNEAEWTKLRESFLESKSSQWIKYEFLMKEGLLKRLLIEVQKDNAFYILDQYEETLKKQIPNEVTAMLIEYLNNTVIHTSNRQEVINLIYDLHKLAHYPNGKKLVKDIIASWKLNYSNNTTLMEELKKAKF